MDKNFIKEIKEQLLEEKSKILADLKQKTDDFSEIAGTDNLTDFTDIASSMTDLQIIENIGSKSATRLNQIDSALLRIENGTYGRCISCKKEIPIERLRAIPYALMCIDCKSREEMKH